MSDELRAWLEEARLNVWECQAEDCGFQWEFMEDGNPYEHHTRFCPRCGRRIEREDVGA